MNTWIQTILFNTRNISLIYYYIRFYITQSKKLYHTQYTHRLTHTLRCHLFVITLRIIVCIENRNINVIGKSKIFVHTLIDYLPSAYSEERFQILCCNKKDSHKFQNIHPCCFKIFSVKNQTLKIDFYTKYIVL